jgi:hypothetical protein
MQQFLGLVAVVIDSTTKIEVPRANPTTSEYTT